MATVMMLLLALAAPLLLAACQKNNDLVASEQIRQSQDACPKGCEAPPPRCYIKGNISAAGNKIYHTPDQQSYPGIKIQPERGERWFCTEAEAINNGWRKSIN